MNYTPRAQPIVALLVAAVCGACASSCRTSMGEVPRPRDLSRGDSEVVALIHKTLDDARRSPGDPQKRAELGIVYEANGFDDLARQCYQQALIGDRSQPRWWYRLALLESRRGDLDAALRAIARVIVSEPSYAPAHWYRGQWLLDIGDPHQAELAFREVLAIHADDTAGVLGLARVRLATGRPREAVMLLEPLIAKHPDERYAQHVLGIAYRDLGRSEAVRFTLAARAGAEATIRDPWSGEVAARRRGYACELEKADAYLRNAQFDGAIVVLRAILRQRPNDVALLNRLGAAYVQTRRPDDAVEVLYRLLSINANRFEAHINLATAFYQKRDYARALVHADRSIELKPVAAAYRIKGIILRDRNHLEAAMAAFALAVRCDPGDLMPQVWNAMILRRLDKRRAALGLLADVRAKDPTLVDALAETAMIWMDEGALQRARIAIGEGIGLDPDNRALAAAQVRLRHLEARRARQGTW